MNKQQLMAKYTKLVAKKLYGINVMVCFSEMYCLRGMFRDKDHHPYSGQDFKKWKKNKLCSVTFNEALFEKKELAPHAWNTLVHEVTHYEQDISYNHKTRRFSHSTNFRNAERRNRNRVDNLRKQFNKAVGWEEDFVWKENEGLM